MRFSTKLCCAVASTAMFGAAPAAAQSVDRIVAFGDSYADDGNLFQFLGISPPAVYPNGRFSNDTNFVDTMAQILDVPVDNFAIGGAFTNNGNINGGPLPGFVTQYSSFLAGGGPAVFPQVSGTFDADDLLVISIGGNDARDFYRNDGGTVAGAPAAAAVSVGEATAGLNALVGAGARNITYLAGDVGRLPEAIGDARAPAGTAFSNAFNSGMQTTLAGYAADGVIVNYLDLNLIGDVVAANLDEFGLQSAGACPIACVTTNPELLSQYLFYVDRVHLTARGFEIVGQYAVQQLQAPLTFEAQTDIGVSAASGFGQTMSGRLDLAGEGQQPLSFYLVGTAGNHETGSSSTNLAYDYDSFGVTGGVEYDIGMGMVGAALAYSRPKADFLGEEGGSRADAWQIGAYANFNMGGAFVEGYAGIGWLDYEMRREAVIDTIKAETDGTSLVAGAEAGYLFPMGGLELGPVIGIQYARVKIAGYTENGDPVLTLNVDDQRASETVGYLGLEASAKTDMGGMSVEPYAKLLLEKELDSSTRDIRYSNTASPIIVNRFDLGGNDDDAYGQLEGGVSLALTSAIALQIQASATVEHPEQDEFSGFAGVKVGF